MYLNINNPILIFSLFLILCFSCKKEDKIDPNNNKPIELPTINWKAGEDIVIEENLYIDSVRFIIEHGVNIYIKSGCSIIFGNDYPVELTAKGSLEKPINFVTYNPDGNPENSFWGSIILHSLYDTFDNPTFEYCNFIKGGGEGSEAVIINNSRSVSIKNCLIDYSMNYGILANHNGEFKEFSGNTIKHTLNHPISITSYFAHTIGKNNNIIVDSLNHGIYLSTESINGSSDSIIWHAQTVPFIIPHSFSADGQSNNILNFKIEEGSTIALGKNASFGLGNNIQFMAIGQAEKPILFTSLVLEPQPGDWNNIRFSNGCIAVLNNCIFEYGGKYESSMADNGMVRLYSATNISMEKCVFQHSESSAITLHKSATNLPYPSFANFSNNRFISLMSYAISLYPQAISSIDKSNIFNNHEIYVKGSTISEGHILWKNFGTDYFSSSYININGESEAIVEIEPGVRIKWNGGGFKVGTASQWGGKLIAVGTDENPIIFTSSKEEPSWGDWGGILFYTNSFPGNILDHCQILYAGEYSLNSWQASIHICCNDTNVTIINSTIAHSSHWGMCIMGSAEPIIENNLFYDNLEGDIITIGN
ncbi:MAG: hypothetical protein K8R58_06455 [Bacteroidales bacterium]|nr:hypothetical protein [Bacteroidales bacterium]